VYLLRPETIAQIDQALIQEGHRLEPEAAQQEKTASVEFREALQSHPGIESAIGALQSGNGLERCRDRTERGFARYIGLGVLGRNLGYPITSPSGPAVKSQSQPSASAQADWSAEKSRHFTGVRPARCQIASYSCCDCSTFRYRQPDRRRNKSQNRHKPGTYRCDRVT